MTISDDTGPGARTVDIRPVPTDEEAAAIVAAVQSAWPGPGGDAEAEAAPSPRWRFSGRWWNRPTPMVRQRPWRR